MAGPAKLVADKRAQTYDRAEAIRQLVEMKSPEAAEALLKRFTFTIDPSITDQEEKEAAFDGIVGIGKPAVDAIRTFCEKAEVLTWPLRMLRAILEDEEYKAELLQLADTFDTEYSRNVEPKLQVVAALEEVSGEDVRTSVERFLEDVNETVRFHAVQTTFAQGNNESIDALVKLLEAEESVRIKNKVCEGFAAKGWKIPETLRERAQKALSDVYDFRFQTDGSFARR
ncbi:MAG: HEAT repeat domain-containing protein [Polyangiaceae bacterium]|nr:HEAT repeat domain-containing protein [Polyangiaceae bacterium]